MEFNSFDFIYFFVAVFAAYAVLSLRWQNWLLLGASYFFYGYWDKRFLLLLVASTVIDFVCGLAIERAQSQRTRNIILASSIAVSLGVLGFFKYFNFFIDTFVIAANRFGFSPEAFHLQLILPVGISFYTFQTMSYVIDVWRRRIPACKRLDDFALFVCFFPQLVAGPIERASALLPQIQSRRSLDYEKCAEGLWFILLGFFNKVVIADNLAVYVKQYQSGVSSLSGGELAVGFYIMVLFLYADFSGYSNIARGTARLLGFDISQNFKLPLFAHNPPDFWRRWHVTLSDWFRDYCFKPMTSAFGRAGRRPAVVALCAFMTLVLCGLWHGAAWNFIIFGALHGVLLVGYYAVRPLLRRPRIRALFAPAPMDILSRILVFHMLSVPVVFFVIPGANDWAAFFRGLFFGTWDQGAWQPLLTLVCFATPLLLVDLFQEYRKDMLAIRTLSRPVRTFIYAVLFFMIVTAGATSTHEFVYFQF